MIEQVGEAVEGIDLAHIEMSDLDIRDSMIIPASVEGWAQVVALRDEDVGMLPIKLFLPQKTSSLSMTEDAAIRLATYLLEAVSMRRGYRCSTVRSRRTPSTSARMQG